MKSLALPKSLKVRTALEVENDKSESHIRNDTKKLRCLVDNQTTMADSKGTEWSK